MTNKTIEQMRAHFVYQSNGMDWTTDAPTVEGWYWVRGYRGIIWLVETFMREDGVCLYSEMDSDYCPIWEGFATHWLGPLPVPAPPQDGNE